MPRSPAGLDRDEFLQLIESKVADRGGKCYLGKILDGVPPEEASIIVEAINNPAYTGSAIAHALNKQGVSQRVIGQTLGEASVSRHRAHKCKCGSGV